MQAQGILSRRSHITRLRPADYWRFASWLAGLVLLLVIYRGCRTWSLAIGSGTWTYLGYVEQLLTGGYPPGNIWYAGLPTEWSTFSVWHLVLAGLVRITGIGSVDLWLLLPIILIPLGFGCQYLWISSLTHNHTSALIGAMASFWLTDIWMLISGPLQRFLVFYVLAPLALFCLVQAFQKREAWLMWSVVGGLFWGLAIQTHTLFALQLSVLIFFFFIFLSIFRDRFWIAEIKALVMFALVGGTVAGYRLLTIVFDPSQTLPLSSFYSNASFWITTIGPLQILDPDRYLWLLSRRTYGIAFLLMGISWIILIRPWRSRRYLVAWITALWLLLGLTYLTPLGVLLGRALTPGVVSEIFMTSNLLPFGLALGVAVVDLATTAVRVLRAACDRLGFISLKKPLTPAATGLIVVSLLAISSVYPLRFYWGLMHDTPVTARDYVGVSALQSLREETGPNSVILSDPLTSHALPALAHRKVMISHRGFIGRNHDQRLIDASKVFDAGTPIDEALDVLSQYDVDFILLNPRFWNSQRDRRAEQFTYGFDFPDDVFLVIQKFRSDTRFEAQTLDDGTVLFKVPVESE